MPLDILKVRDLNLTNQSANYTELPTNYYVLLIVKLLLWNTIIGSAIPTGQVYLSEKRMRLIFGGAQERQPDDIAMSDSDEPKKLMC